ncbi:MAG: NAD-dependent epimerase/dehydratase family protein [Syntrophothermus sp.]
MKVLFIGGTGNISSAVSKLASERGIDLYLLNRGLRSQGADNAHTIHADIANSSDTEILKEHKWDAVVNWIAFNENDIKRDYELFNGRTRQYIFISSASCYQRPPRNYIITESTPLENPFWDYSRNKIKCETLLNQLHKEKDFPATIIRPSHTYNTVIPLPVAAWTEYTACDRIKRGKKVIVPGDGTSLWTLTHADDFASGFLGILGLPAAVGETFHITSDEVLSWNQIYEAIGNAFGKKTNMVHIPSDLLAHLNPELKGTLLGDKSYCAVFDNSKIKKFVPGYKAAIPFSEGIKRTIEWFEADPARRVVKKETNDFLDRTIDQFEKLFI